MAWKKRDFHGISGRLAKVAGKKRLSEYFELFRVFFPLPGAEGRHSLGLGMQPHLILMA